MQKCPVRPPALINANIIIFCFFVLFFVVQRREKKRPDLEHVRASPVGPVGGEEDEEEKNKTKTGVRLHDHLFHMYPAVRTETEWMVYIPPWLAWRHTHVSPKKKRKKLIYMIPNRPVLLFTSFLFLHYYKRKKKGNFSSCVQRFSIFARAAWINMGMEHTQLAAIYIYIHDDFCWRLPIDTTQFFGLVFPFARVFGSLEINFFISYIAMKMSAFYEPQNIPFLLSKVYLFFFFSPNKRTVSFFFQLH